MNLRTWIAVAVAAVTAVGCASDNPDNITADTNCDRGNQSGSIQRAVDLAEPGDVITIPAGTYHEAVVVNTDRVVIRGEDRNTVILDGCDQQSGVGILVYSDQVTVENLTVRNYATTGIMFNGFAAAGDTTMLDGFAARYITATNNGMYGLYAFQASRGIFADSYTAGHGDSGIYVGQCAPCSTVVTDIVSEYNSVGYEGTNASEVYVINSTWRNNRIGITPNSQNLERLAPATGGLVAGNLVIDNNDPAAPEQVSGGNGLGIAVGGGHSNTIVKNHVEGHSQVGIAVTSLDGFDPVGNVIADNTVIGNHLDIGYWADSDGNNEFNNNRYDTSSPNNIDDNNTPGATVRLTPGPAQEGTIPYPTEHSTMPADTTPIVLPHTGPYPTVDDIETPQR